MDGIPFLDILIFGMVALFIFLRLFAVLGRRTGSERQPGPDPLQRPPQNARAAEDRSIVPFPRSAQFGTPSLANSVVEGIKAIRRVDPQFDPDAFINGAGHAYEMIVGAFAAGDKPTLKGLLDEPVYNGFVQAIDQRIQAGQTQESHFAKIKGAEIREISVKGTLAEITVRFASDMITVTRDSRGAVVAGHPHDPREVVDLWTFARDLRSRDPNWLLVATGGAV